MIRSRLLSAENPSSATFRPQAFSASRRFAPRPDAAGLFHPTTTSRVHAMQGLLPPCSSDAVTRDTSPLAVGVAFTHCRRQWPCPLRLDFEASIHTEMRSQTVRFHPPRWPLPSSAFSSSRSSTRSLCPGYPRQPAHGLGSRRLRIGAEAPLRSRRLLPYSVLRSRTTRRGVSAPTAPARGFEPLSGFPSSSTPCAL